jgi:hypothetical protein
MPLVLADRVQETTTSTGTGTITLAGASVGFNSFSVIGNGNTTYYTIAGGSQWEVGVGTYTSSGTTLARNTVLSSSNSNALVNFSAGIKNVFVTYPAGKSVYYDASNIVTATNANVTTLLTATNVNVTTQLTAVSITETSSIRYKENVAPITDALDLIMQMQGVVYDRRNTGIKNEAGFIAEKLYKIAPNLVKLNEKGEPDSIAYTRIIAYLVEGMKDLKEELDAIRSK